MKLQADRKAAWKTDLSEDEPEEYVGENKNGGAHKENKQTCGAFIPNFLPLYVLGLFLEKSNRFVPDLCALCAYLTEEILYTFHNSLHSAASAIKTFTQMSDAIAYFGENIILQILF